MKTVILAGGQGTRIRDYSDRIPKALIPINGRPMLEHVLEIYASQGFRQFIIAVGHLGYRIDKWLEMADAPSDWDIQIVHTGQDTPTGGRVKALANQGLLTERLFLTYADGMADVNLQRLLQTHETSPNAQVTITAIRPRSQFGVLDLANGDQVIGFREKPILDMWVSAGFMVMEPSFLEMLTMETDLEKEALPKLVDLGGLQAYRHLGYFQQIDNVKDMETVNRLCKQGRAPWTREIEEIPTGWEGII